MLHDQLVTIDHDLEFVFAEPPSHRVVEDARRLLNARADLCDEMMAAGFQPWGVPIDELEAKVS